MTTANAGSLAGSASFAAPDAYPLFSNLAPMGAYAPTNNAGSVDFGPIAEGEFGRAVDLVPESTQSADGNLGALNNGFTICGWLNARQLDEGWGGNRAIASRLRW